MIVSEATLESVVERLSHCAVLVADVETTGLRAYTGDQIFGLAIASQIESFYFPLELLLEDPWIEKLKPLFDDPARTWLAHRAVFDAGFLKKRGLEIKGTLYCTMTMARVQFNDHFQGYSLDKCGQRIGLKKDDAVKEYLDKHELFTRKNIPGKKTVWKDYRFNEVPLEIIGPYAKLDAEICFKLFEHQTDTFEEWEKTRAHKASIWPVIKLECEFSKVIQEMEENGIRLDRDYCNRAAAFEASRAAMAQSKFLEATGVPLVDSAKALLGVLGPLGVEPGKTEKGNPSYTDDILARSSHPAVLAVRDHRDASKRLGTYFSSFLYYSEKTGRIHCSFNQAGTATARLSASEPNLQNLSDEDEADTPFPIRRAFVADDDCLVLSIDYKAMEFRQMLDMAGQLDMCKLLMEGFDPHLATAQLAGITRQEAKTLNFLLLYGGGVVLLAIRLFDCLHDEDTLGAICRKYVWQSALKEGDIERLKDLDPNKVQHDIGEIAKAQALKSKYFEKLPLVSKWIEGVMDTAKRRGYVFNWAGRRYQFPVSKFAYKAPNYLIQGGCSDIMRVALISISKLLKGKKSKLQLAIHDEVVISLHKTELDLIEPIREAMRTAYPYKHLPMDCSVYLGSSLHDLEEWNGQTGRDEIQGEGLERPTAAAV